MAEAHLAEVAGLTVEFHTRAGRVRAVDGVSLHIDRGETLAILGESGSGKSVTASALMGLIDSPPGYITAGRVTFDGRDLLTIGDAERRRLNGNRIAMIFQDPLAALNPVYTVGWQIAETFIAHGESRAVARRRAVELLERVGIPEATRRAGDYPHQFSGGQRQRIMIAAAIALQPDLLIADEPTTALDVTVQAQILELLKDLQREYGMAILIITHDLGVVAKVADRVMVMKSGRVVETGAARAVLATPQHAYTQLLLAAVPGRGALAEPPAESSELLSVASVSKVFSLGHSAFRSGKPLELKALNGISFNLQRGEALGIVGESGSGKSTLGRLLLRLDQPTSGRIVFDGADLSSLSPAQQTALPRKLQVVFQDPTASLNPRMRVSEIVTEPWIVHPDVVPPAQRRARMLELLRQVGLQDEHAERYPHQFSGGQRQRIAIARALALRPDLIICDEAVSALDVSVQAQIMALLKSLQREFGLSYIFIAHDLPVVRDFADRVLVMQRGEVVEQGRTRDVFEAPQHPYTRQLLAASPSLDLIASASSAGQAHSSRTES